MLKLQQLRVIESQEIASLRERMNRVGCVFKFVVLEVEPEVSVDEALHLRALMAMYEQIMAGQREWQQSLMLQPDYVDRVPPALTWNLDQAVATLLDRAQVFDPSIILPPQLGGSTLFDAFCNPPHSISLRGESALVLFKEWLKLLGFCEQDDIAVLNWVDGFVTNCDGGSGGLADTTSWSNYFDDGLEWWGIWCLTIWNPRLRTLSALTASTTD